MAKDCLQINQKGTRKGRTFVAAKVNHLTYKIHSGFINDIG